MSSVSGRQQFRSEHSRGYSFGPIFLKLSQDIIIVKSRSLGQIFEKACEYCRSHFLSWTLIRMLVLI